MDVDAAADGAGVDREVRVLKRTVREAGWTGTEARDDDLDRVIPVEVSESSCQIVDHGLGGRADRLGAVHGDETDPLWAPLDLNQRLHPKSPLLYTFNPDRGRQDPMPILLFLFFSTFLGDVQSKKFLYTSSHAYCHKFFLLTT